MPKDKEKIQKQLQDFKAQLPSYEAKLAKAKRDGDKSGQVNYAMAVAGLKNSIKEIETQLRKM